jgi:hypothetical protein
MISVQKNHILESCEFVTSGSRIEAGSEGGQIVWMETVPSHLKNRSQNPPDPSEHESNPGGVSCKGAKLHAASR